VVRRERIRPGERPLKTRTRTPTARRASSGPDGDPEDERHLRSPALLVLSKRLEFATVDRGKLAGTTNRLTTSLAEVVEDVGDELPVTQFLEQKGVRRGLDQG
jgi:hypothetical protein